MADWLTHLGLVNVARKLVTGESFVIENIRSKDAKLVIVATDASMNTKKKIKDKCTFYGVQYIEAGTSEEISHAINKANRMVIAIIDEGFSKGLLAKITK